MISQDAGGAIPRGLNPPPLWPSASRPDVAGPSGLPTARAPVAGGSREVCDGRPPDARAPTCWKKEQDSPGKVSRLGCGTKPPGGLVEGGLPLLFPPAPLLCGAADLLSAGIVTLTVPGYLGTLHGTLPASAGLRRYSPSLVQGDAGGALIYQ